jgi:hypothetical protein
MYTEFDKIQLVRAVAQLTAAKTALENAADGIDMTILQSFMNDSQLASHLNYLSPIVADNDLFDDYPTYDLVMMQFDDLKAERLSVVMGTDAVIEYPRALHVSAELIDVTQNMLGRITLYLTPKKTPISYMMPSFFKGVEFTMMS